MVSITIIIPSYNKEKYIRKALESIFMQETDYEYKIIVADDCSTDKTLEILEEYSKKYPGKITILKSNINQKLYKNILRAYEITKTDYFCVLDPDDYWINKKHLQTAIDFLEKNQDYTIYSTGLLLKYPDGNEKKQISKSKRQSCDFKDGLNLKLIVASTQSIIYRNVIFKNGIPDKMINLESSTMEDSFRGDTFRNYIHLNKGKSHYEKTIDAIYNITEEGIWTTLNDLEQHLLNAVVFKDLWLYFDKKYIELLVNSYKIYKSIELPLENLIKINDEKRLNKALYKIKILNTLYNENIDIINKSINKNLALGYKIILPVYKKLSKKMKKKGLL